MSVEGDGKGKKMIAYTLPKGRWRGKKRQTRIDPKNISIVKLN